jgi:hypothetical protein
MNKSNDSDDDDKDDEWTETKLGIILPPLVQKIIEYIILCENKS